DPQDIVSVLLADATNKVVAGQLTEPRYGSALAAYQRVLEIDAHNVDAKRGVQSLVAHHLGLARQFLARNQTSKAKEHLETVHRIEPRNSIASRLRLQLDRREQRLTVTALLADANAKWSTGERTEQAADSALALYQKILTIEPGNFSAQSGIQNIINHHASLLNQALMENRTAAAKKHLRIIEDIKPQYTHASKLHAQIAAREQAIEIAGLLARADDKLAAGQLALADYQQVLTLDADNARAKSGIREIIQHHLDSANDFLAKNQTQQAEQQLIALEDIEPDNAEAAQIRARIKSAAEKARRQRIEKERKAALLETEKEKQRTQTAARNVVAPTDIAFVNGLFMEFKLALEHRNLERLQRVARLSADKHEFIVYLFGRHKVIGVRVSDLALEPDGTASATMTIEKLITATGDTVIPAPSWQQSRLITAKEGDSWRKIEW
ncbi:MAG: tetratricopeptide repeat protein, partial [Gammaproteobacteria bacterium]